MVPYGLSIWPIPWRFCRKKPSWISPAEAWERLQQNDFLISLDEGWGLLPGDRLAAAYSRIEKVELVYWPRYYQVIRNEHYHIKYAFSGTTQIGDRQMRFTALVDAVH